MLTKFNFQQALFSFVAVCVCATVVSAARVQLVPVYDQAVDESSFVPQVIPRSASDLETAASGHGELLSKRNNN